MALWAAMVAREKMSGETNELVKLDRRVEDKAGIAHPGEEWPASIPEQLTVHGEHLALSASVGAAYGAARREEGSPVPSGLAFGMGFYALAYGIIGPALGATSPPIWPSMRPCTRLSG